MNSEYAERIAFQRAVRDNVIDLGNVSPFLRDFEKELKIKEKQTKIEVYFKFLLNKNSHFK